MKRVIKFCVPAVAAAVLLWAGAMLVGPVTAHAEDPVVKCRPCKESIRFGIKALGPDGGIVLTCPLVSNAEGPWCKYVCTTPEGPLEIVKRRFCFSTVPAGPGGAIGIFDR